MARSNFIVRGGGDFSGLYKELNQAQKQLNGFKSGIGKTLKGIGALFGGIAVGRTIKDFVQTAARTETMAVAMNSVARASGYATAAVNEHKKAVMDMGIAEQESMQILTRFMQAQLDTADASKLARVAQDAAVIANMNSSEAAEQMTEAIAKQRPVLLSQFGMTKNLNEIYKEYGASLGKTTAQLTTAEKKQAMLNYILQEGEKIAGTYEASMGAVGKQIGSLPRYWQTLQNAIATPLALPGLSVAVEAITNGLKNAIAWAEANEATLRRWGQNVTNIVSGVINAFGWITRTLANNWQMIKLVATGLLSYAAATKIVTAAVGIFNGANLLMNGTLVTQIPLLSTVSKAVAIYRTQIALAPAATNLFTGALLKLRVGLQAVHAAIGPVGWAILAISALLTGGVLLWNKYNNSLPDTDQSLANAMQEIDDAMQGIGDSSIGAADGQEELADGIGKVTKAAKGALAPFDELNILQQNMGGGSGGIPSIGGLGNPFEGLNIEKPIIEPIDTSNLDNAIDESKNKWKGFFMWISDWWDGLKQKFMIPITVPSPIFAEIPSPVYEPEWGLTPPFVPSPIFQPIPNPVYNPNWNLDYPQLKPLKIPAPDLNGFDQSLETMERNLGGAKTALEKTTVELSRELGEEASKGSKKIEEGLSISWATAENNYKKHKENVGIITSGISTVLVSNLNQGLSKVGTNLINTTTAVQTNLQTFGKNVSTIAGEAAKSFANNFSAGFQAVSKNVVTFATNAGTNIKAFGVGALSIAAETARGFASNFTNGLSTAWNKFKEFAQATGEKVSGWFSDNKKVVTTTAIVAGVAIGAGALALAAPAVIPYAGAALGGFAAIPALAKGGITNGPMVAMIGDNPGGREVISPLDDLRDIIASAVGSAVLQAMQFSITGSNDNREVVLEIDGTRLGRALLPKLNQESERLGYRTILQTT